MDATLPWGGHEEPAELPELAANDRSVRGRADPGGLDQGGGWIGALSTSNAIIAEDFKRKGTQITAKNANGRVLAAALCHSNALGRRRAATGLGSFAFICGDLRTFAF